MRGMDMGLKKKIVLSLLALEIVSLPLSVPVAAQIVDRVVFSAPPRAAFVEMPRAEPGKTVLIVASNAPFSVISSGMVGELSVDVTVSGHINGQAFGANAQDPGMGDGCVFQSLSAPTLVYTSFRKTAARRGKVVDQAVKIEISYDPSLRPVFDVKPTAFAEVKQAAPLQTCLRPRA